MKPKHREHDELAYYHVIIHGSQSRQLLSITYFGFLGKGGFNSYISVPLPSLLISFVIQSTSSNKQAQHALELSFVVIKWF